MKRYIHIRPDGGHFVDDETVQQVRQMLREGMSLKDAAQHTRYFADDLDHALWTRIGGTGPRGPMF